jgi:opacity protein-like surface antigen
VRWLLYRSSWGDGIVGIRGHMPIGGRFALTGLADVGGFGIGSSSNLSWQVIGTLDYAFSEDVTGRLGYRYLSIDKTSSDLSMDIDMFGPLIGLTWAF